MNYVVFIISHGRSDNVKTVSALEECGYSGKTLIVIDNTDSQIDEYKVRYGEKNVIVFDKEAIAKTTDQADNFNNLRTTTHARNACFEIAKTLGYEYFIVLDDDYTVFHYRFNALFDFENPRKKIKNLDAVFDSIFKFYSDCPTVDSIAMSQGGEFMGGVGSWFGQKIRFKRKCMNSFFCSTKRPFKFVSRLNEDVNTYVSRGVRGKIFFTTGQVSLEQVQTQKSSGGMTEAYIENGTYVKSFYTVMYQPSSVRVQHRMNRWHHTIKWDRTVPMILREKVKKAMISDG